VSPLTTKVLVTASGGPAGLSALRSIRKLNWVRVVAADADPFAAGLYQKGVEHALIPKGNDPCFSKALLELCIRRGIDVVLPCSDEEVWTISRKKHILEDHGIIVPIPDHETIMRAADKFTCLKTAERQGIAIPVTFAPAKTREAVRVLRSLKPPLVVRPRLSRGARGVTYCRSRTEAANVWAAVREEFGSAMIQEFIPGGRGSVRVVLSLWDREGTLRAVGVMKKLSERPETGGVAVAGVTIKDPTILKLGIMTVKALGPWYGPAGVEFKISRRTLKPYLLEVNPRLQGITYLFTSAGIDFPVLWLKAALGKLRPSKPILSYATKYFVRSWEDITLDRLFRYQHSG